VSAPAILIFVKQAGLSVATLPEDYADGGIFFCV